MSVFIHIGPPKTATTSLQTSIIPHLGVPFAIKPGWARGLARDPGFVPARSHDQDLIVSEEMLGDFGAYPPQQLAARLASMFGDATILFCVRDPLALFYSLYRQRLVNEIELQVEAFKKSWRYEPATPAQFLASRWAEFRRNGTGFFAIIDTDSVKSAFERHFTFRTYDFALLQKDPMAFAGAFAKLCDRPLSGILSWENQTTAAKLEEALAQLPPEAPDGLADRYRMFFGLRLNAECEEFITIGPPRQYLPVTQSALFAEAQARLSA